MELDQNKPRALTVKRLVANTPVACSPPMSLLDIPQEIRHGVYSFLAGKDLIRSCGRVSRAVAADVCGAQFALWRHLCHAHFGPTDGPDDADYQTLYRELYRLSKMPVVCGDSVVRIHGDGIGTRETWQHAAAPRTQAHPNAQRMQALPYCWDDGGCMPLVLSSTSQIRVPQSLADREYLVNYCYAVQLEDSVAPASSVRRVNGLTFTPNRMMQFQDMHGRVIWSEQLPQDTVVNTLNMVLHEGHARGTQHDAAADAPVDRPLLVYSFTNAAGKLGMKAKDLNTGEDVWIVHDDCNKRMMAAEFLRSIFSTESAAFYQLVSRDVQTGQERWRIPKLPYNLYRFTMQSRFVLLNTHFNQTVVLDNSGKMAFFFDNESVGVMWPMSPPLATCTSASSEAASIGGSVADDTALPVSTADQPVETFFIASDTRLARIRAMPVQDIESTEPAKVSDEHVVWQLLAEREDKHFRQVPVWAGWSQHRQDVVLLVFSVDQCYIQEIEVLRVNTVDGTIRWQRTLNATAVAGTVTRNRHVSAADSIYAEVRGTDLVVVSQLFVQESVFVLDVRDGELRHEILRPMS